jgi:hypothetical protein
MRRTTGGEGKLGKKIHELTTGLGVVEIEAG